MTVRLGFIRASQLYVVLNVLSVFLFATLGLQFGRMVIFGTGFGSSGEYGYGSLYRIAGVDSSGAAARVRAMAWLAGILIVMAYAIPCMAITARSLFAINPMASGEGDEAKVANKVNKESVNGAGIQDGDMDALRRRLVKTIGNGRKSANSNSSSSSDGNGHLVSNTGEQFSPSNSIISLLEFIPVVPQEELGKIVSLQTILTPVVLSISLAIGSVAAARAMV